MIEGRARERGDSGGADGARGRAFTGGLVVPYTGPRVMESTFELEARLGTWQFDGVRKGRGRFVNGVSRDFMDRVLALCEGWADWCAVGGWVEMHDYVGRINGRHNQMQVGCRCAHQVVTETPHACLGFRVQGLGLAKGLGRCAHQVVPEAPHARRI
ncbi:MAG: hypothetical protein ACPIOQ_11965, partial [Promethearchaeia archaeon]